MFRPCDTKVRFFADLQSVLVDRRQWWNCNDWVYIILILNTLLLMLIGWTTTATREDAERLATDAVERRLAACCHVDGPVLSIYNWEGALQKEEEYRVTFKFLSQKAPALENWLHDNHPYENPQWITVAAERISQNYLIWAQKETT